MNLKTKEVESRDSPTEVRSFPTIRLEDDNGNATGRIVEGKRDSGDQILKELGIKVRKEKGRKTRKQMRRSRHRTLRNNVAFV